MKKNGKCQFSHKPEDVEYWRAANALGKDGVTNLYRNSYVKLPTAKSGGSHNATSPAGVPVEESRKIKGVDADSTSVQHITVTKTGMRRV